MKRKPKTMASGRKDRPEAHQESEDWRHEHHGYCPSISSPKGYGAIRPLCNQVGIQRH